ncbi:MAG: riboflavin synthase, partial [Pseudomonadota bacterium]
MFTGLVTDIGTVRALDRRGDLRARIGTAYDPEGIDLGAS